MGRSSSGWDRCETERMAKRARTGRRRSARGEGDALRDELLDAAEHQLMKAGSTDGVSIRAIVNEVGVSPPALYMHFEDKDTLFFAVCERRFADFGKVLERAMQPFDDPVEKLRAMGNAYVRYGMDNAEHYQIMFSTAGAAAEGLLTMADPGLLGFVLLIDTVTDAIDAGYFESDDAMMTAMTIWSAVHGVVMLHLSKASGPAGIDVPDVEAVQVNVCDVVLRGLLRR